MDAEKRKLGFWEETGVRIQEIELPRPSAEGSVIVLVDPRNSRSPHSITITKTVTITAKMTTILPPHLNRPLHFNNQKSTIDNRQSTIHPTSFLSPSTITKRVVNGVMFNETENV